MEKFLQNNELQLTILFVAWGLFVFFKGKEVSKSFGDKPWVEVNSMIFSMMSVALGMGGWLLSHFGIPPFSYIGFFATILFFLIVASISLAIEFSNAKELLLPSKSLDDYLRRFQ